MVSDEALYERLLAGDSSAFDALYARYEKPLFGFVLRWIDDRAEAEDIFHEAFMAVLRERRAAFERASFRAWIFQVARNLCLNRARSRDRGRRAQEAKRVEDRNVERAPAAVAEQHLEEHEAAVALRAAVGKLPDALAEVYHLRIGGMSYEEMAQVLEAPLGTIKSRMHEVVARLRKEMEPWSTNPKANAR